MTRPGAQKSVFTLGMQSGNLIKVNKQVAVLVTCPGKPLSKYFTTVLEVWGPYDAVRGLND